MRNHERWLVVVVCLLATGSFASNVTTNTPDLGFVPYLIAPTNAVEIEKLRKQRKIASEAAEKEFQTLLKTYPWAKQIKRSIEQALSSSRKVFAQEAGAITEELGRR
jgi:outer membrane protein assembly factor BamD (BamD/ComL family)